jgi:two-component system OmpR family response regulator
MMSPLPSLSTTRNILVVDDDAELRGQISTYLTEHGFQVHGAPDGRGMDEVLASEPIDLIVLDLMLPGEDGLSICRRLSGGGGPAIIMLSAMGEEVDRVLGLELGADDYLPKSSSPRELMARVRAVLRRQDEVRGGGPRRGAAYHFLGFTLDIVRRRLRAPNGTTVLLTGGEYALLQVLLEHPQRILSRDQLLDMTRGADAEVFDRAIDVQISRLRRKLDDPAARVIKTCRGAGYLLDAPVARS